MAHDVAFSKPERKLGKRDIVFSIRKDGVDWFPLKKQLGYGLDWSQVDHLFQKNGEQRRRTPR